jgi:UDP-N-acetylglucosamine transferase subunit ALG13
MDNSNNNIKTDANEPNTASITILKREEYADLLLFVVNTMTSAIKGGKISKADFNKAIEKFVSDIQVELVRTGEGSILPDATLKKLKSFGRLLFNEYNRIKNNG